MHGLLTFALERAAWGALTLAETCHISLQAIASCSQLQSNEQYQSTLPLAAAVEIASLKCFLLEGSLMATG